MRYGFLFLAQVLSCFCGVAQSSDTSDAEGFRRMGNLYYRINAYDKALENFAKAVVTNPLDKSALLSKGRCEMQLQKPLEALEDFSSALRLDDQFADAYYLRALVELYYTRQPDAALSDFNKLSGLSPFGATDHIMRSMCLIGLGNYEEAIKDCDKALELDPTFPEPAGGAILGKASSWFQMGQYQKAITEYDKLMKDPSRKLIALAERSRAKKRLKDYTGALADINEYLLYRPKSDTAYNDRGLIYADQDKYPEALPDFEKAISLNPGNASAWSNRALCYLHSKKYPEAKADVEKALQLDPEDAETIGTYGILKSETGDQKGACEWIGRAYTKNHKKEWKEWLDKNCK